jgi:ribonuclease HI
MENKIIIYCDGGSRGNPGKSAAAFVVVEDGKVIHSEANYLGIKTNNFAEYSAVLSALNWIGENTDKINKEIIFNLDSELVVKQIIGLYKVKNIKLKEIHLNIKNILENLPFKILFKNISREKNAKADFLVNQKLDNLP